MCFFFFNDTATTEIYTLSLHDALPILLPGGGHGGVAAQCRAHEGGPGSEDRREGRGVDRPAARAWVVEPVVRPAAGDSASADADRLPRAADGRPDSGRHAAGADARGCLEQALRGRLEPVHRF